MKGMANMKGLGQSIADKNLEIGIQQGIQQGERLFATLVGKLIADGRIEDVKRASEEECVRQQLYDEYGLHE